MKMPLISIWEFSAFFVLNLLPYFSEYLLPDGIPSSRTWVLPPRRDKTRWKGSWYPDTTIPVCRSLFPQQSAPVSAKWLCRSPCHGRQGTHINLPDKCRLSPEMWRSCGKTVRSQFLRRTYPQPKALLLFLYQKS